MVYSEGDLLLIASFASLNILLMKEKHVLECMTTLTS